MREIFEMKKERLLTSSYFFIIAANFLLSFAFYLLLPVFPFYLSEVFATGKGLTGIILSCYTVATLSIRPFSGYLLDTFARKPLYLLAFFVFMTVFAGYMFAGTLLVFTLMRIIHGFSFGMVTVSGNTIVIDIMPSARRGEGLGYYGLANNIAMAVGPMTGLLLHEQYSFNVIFIAALSSCVLGFITAILVKTPAKQPVSHEPISLDRFILLKGIPSGVVLLLLSIPYGMTVTYVAMYGQSIGITGGMGLFFTMQAIGMAVSRLFSGKQVDKGRVTQVIALGIAIVCFGFFVLSGCASLTAWNPEVGTIVFFGIALFLGIGFGTMFPAFNTMFVNLAPHNRRGTATSTYLTSWDVGIGLGLVLGGSIAEMWNFQSAYLLGGCLSLVSITLFCWKVAPYYHRNKLR